MSYFSFSGSFTKILTYFVLCLFLTASPNKAKAVEPITVLVVLLPLAITFWSGYKIGSDIQEKKEVSINFVPPMDIPPPGFKNPQATNSSVAGISNNTVVTNFGQNLSCFFQGKEGRYYGEVNSERSSPYYLSVTLEKDRKIVGRILVKVYPEYLPKSCAEYQSTMEGGILGKNVREDLNQISRPK